MRSFCSVRFVLALAVMLGVLFAGGFDSQLYRLCVPLVCTFPYACGFSEEYKSGFARLALPRTSIRAYILGKFFACGIAGGAAEVLAVWIFATARHSADTEYFFLLIFLSGFLWAVVAATLAVASGSRYVAYGGAFVLYYFLVILNERYFGTLYCLHPHEWYAPEHIWMFEDTGVALLLCGLCAVLLPVYACIARRRLSDV